MNSFLLSCIICLLGIFAQCYGYKLISSQIEIYKKILSAYYKSNGINPGNDNDITVEGLTLLMSLLENNPKYNRKAVEAMLLNIYEHDYPSITWHDLESYLNVLYQDRISDDPYEPQEIHISLGNSTSKDSMKVMWVTMKNLINPFVEYLPNELNEWKFSSKIGATNYTYTVPQNWWEIFTGMIYEADMVELKPNKKYKYRVGGYDEANKTIRYSEIYSFKSQPLSNDPNQKTVAATLADHGTIELFGFVTVDKMKKLEQQLGYDFVFVAGDLSYAGLSSAMPYLNISKEDEFEHMWDLLGIQNQLIAANYPWMIGVGNHERFYDWAAVSNRYKMPQNSLLETNQNFWYSFEYGNSYWISISSEHSLDEGSPQMNFIHSSLESAVSNRKTVPWIIVTIHKPLYCSAMGTPGGYADKLENIFLEYDVDLVIAGHMHCYERVHPVKAGITTVYPQKKEMGIKKRKVDVYNSLGYGPVHVIQGHAGGMQAERFIQPKPDWSAIRMANGYIVPSINDKNYQYFNNHRIDVSDSSMDSLDILADWPLYESDNDEAISKHINYLDTYGFGVVTFLNATHLHFKLANDEVDDIEKDNITRAGHDEFWVIKQRI
eukprot:gene7480-10194_t